MLKKRKYIYFSKYLLLIFGIVILDQLTKGFLINYFQQSHSKQLININPVLDLVPVWNHGIGLGLFNSYRYANMIFIFINVIIMLCFFFIFFFNTNSSIYIKLVISFILGGGIGNILDRVFRGAVFDFIWFNYYSFSFPVFNLADASVSFGGIILSVFIVKQYFIKNHSDKY